jgi:hypothetical protein
MQQGPRVTGRSVSVHKYFPVHRRLTVTHPSSGSIYNFSFCTSNSLYIFLPCLFAISDGKAPIYTDITFPFPSVVMNF